MRPGEPSEHLFRELLGGWYLGGAVEFEIREDSGLSPATREVVRTFLRRTLPPEVLSEGALTIRLRDVPGRSPVSVGPLVAPMGQLVLALQLDSAQSWRPGPRALDVPFAERDEEVDRPGWFIERTLVRRLTEGGSEEDPSGPGPFGYFTTARSLERIADHAVRISEAGGQLAEMSVPPEPIRSLEPFHAPAREHLAAGLTSLGTGDGRRANELLDLGEALHETCHALHDRLFPPSGRSRTPPTPAALLARRLHSVDRSVAYAQDITGVVLDRATTGPAPESLTPGRLPHRATAEGSAGAWA
ncbi:MAG: PhoU domain-containing protein [Thermoplasmata archaeon]